MNFTTMLHKRKRDDKNSLEAWLTSSDPAQQALADETLAQMGQDTAFAYLLSVARKLVTTRKRRVLILFGLNLLVAMILFFALPNLLTHISGQLFFMAMVGPASNAVIMYLSRPDRLHHMVMLRIAKMGDVRALPLLIDFTRLPHMSDKAIVQGIARLLPQLTSDSASLLSKRQWNLLTCMIPPRGGYSFEADDKLALTQAYMAACAQTEQTSGLKYVRYLANGKCWDTAAPQLQQLAREYLPRLEQAAREQKATARR